MMNLSRRARGSEMLKVEPWKVAAVP
jgi:hypothetical protein